MQQHIYATSITIDWCWCNEGLQVNFMAMQKFYMYKLLMSATESYITTMIFDLSAFVTISY